MRKRVSKSPSREDAAACRTSAVFKSIPRTSASRRAVVTQRVTSANEFPIKVSTTNFSVDPSRFASCSPTSDLTNDPISFCVGCGNSSTRSKRRHTAGSRSSGWFVAAIRTPLAGHSSIACTRTVTSLFNSPSSAMSSRRFAIASNSSSKSTVGLCWAKSRTSRRPNPK